MIYDATQFRNKPERFNAIFPPLRQLHPSKLWEAWPNSAQELPSGQRVRDVVRGLTGERYYLNIEHIPCNHLWTQATPEQAREGRDKLKTLIGRIRDERPDLRPLGYYSVWPLGLAGNPDYKRQETHQTNAKFIVEGWTDAVQIHYPAHYARYVDWSDADAWQDYTRRCEFEAWWCRHSPKPSTPFVWNREWGGERAHPVDRLRDILLYQLDLYGSVAVWGGYAGGHLEWGPEAELMECAMLSALWAFERKAGEDALERIARGVERMAGNAPVRITQRFLESIDGIGPVTAKRIMQAIEEAR